MMNMDALSREIKLWLEILTQNITSVNRHFSACSNQVWSAVGAPPPPPPKKKKIKAVINYVIEMIIKLL